MASVANAVVPGQRLGHVQEYSAGSGTYSHQDFLYASVVGIKKIIEAQGEVLFLLVSFTTDISLYKLRRLGNRRLQRRRRN